MALTCLGKSDKVEAWVTLLKVFVDHRRSILLSTTFADQGSEAMGITNATGLLDRARDVVVGVTQFVSQVLNLVRRLTDRVVKDGESCRRRHSLLGGNTHKVELVSVPVCHALVDDCASQWVLEPADVACEDPCVHPLAAVNIHKLARGGEAARGNCRFDLVDLRHADGLHLALTYAITVENNSARRDSIVLFECFQSTLETTLEILSSFLADLVLYHAC